MGGFAFKLYGKGEHSGKTVQPCGDAFGGRQRIIRKTAVAIRKIVTSDWSSRLTVYFNMLSNP